MYCEGIRELKILQESFHEIISSFSRFNTHEAAVKHHFFNFYLFIFYFSLPFPNDHRRMAWKDQRPKS